MRPLAPSPSIVGRLGIGRAMPRSPPTPVATRIGIAPRRTFSSSMIRRDNQSRAKASGVKSVVNRPEITPLFLFTGGIISLALFFGGRHLIKDKELRLDHKVQNRLATQTDQLDFDAMGKVAEDPDGKLTKDAIQEDQKRNERLKDIRDEKEQKANNKV